MWSLAASCTRRRRAASRWGASTFHGNNKAPDGARDALDAGIGRDRGRQPGRDRAAARTDGRAPRQQPVLLRRGAGGRGAHPRAHSRRARSTPIRAEHRRRARPPRPRPCSRARTVLELVGLHAHIGSQIFELEPYRETIERLFGLAASFAPRTGSQLRELSPAAASGCATRRRRSPLRDREIATALGGEVREAAAGRHGFTELPG